MLLIEKIQETRFSPSESILIEYIMKQNLRIADMTIKEIADTIFVHPSILIRIAKKLDFDGWTSFKTAFLEEQRYLNRHFEKLNPNLPFNANDDVMTIAQKIAALEQTTIADTLSLIKAETLNKAVQLLNEAREIKIFTSNANILISQDFALKMRRLKKPTAIAEILGEQIYEAHSTDDKTCILLISYTGENELLSKIIPVLRANRSPIISITGIGESSLSKASDCNLQMTTRERLYSKIGNFTTSLSISYLLDVLYAGFFAQAYYHNLNHLIRVGAAFDHRTSTAPVMKENGDTLTGL